MREDILSTDGGRATSSSGIGLVGGFGALGSVAIQDVPQFDLLSPRLLLLLMHGHAVASRDKDLI